MFVTNVQMTDTTIRGNQILHPSIHPSQKKKKIPFVPNFQSLLQLEKYKVNVLIIIDNDDFECKKPAIILGSTQIQLHENSSFPHKYDNEFPIQSLRAVLLRIMAIRAPRSFQGALWLPCLVLLLFFITFTYASPPWRPRLGERAKNSVYKYTTHLQLHLTQTN